MPYRKSYHDALHERHFTVCTRGAMFALQVFFDSVRSVFIGSYSIAVAVLFACYVLIATSAHVIRSLDNNWHSVLRRALLITAYAAVGFLIGWMLERVGWKLFDLRQKYMDDLAWRFLPWSVTEFAPAKAAMGANRERAILALGLYFSLLRPLIFVPLGHILGRVAPAGLRQPLLHIYDKLVHATFSNALRLSFAFLTGLTIALFLWATNPTDAMTEAAVLGAVDETVVQGALWAMVMGIGQSITLAALAIGFAYSVPIARWPNHVIVICGVVVALLGFLGAEGLALLSEKLEDEIYGRVRVNPPNFNFWYELFMLRFRALF